MRRAVLDKLRLHDDLHWLDVADRVTYKLDVIMHRCRHGKAPQYLVDCCTPVTHVIGRQRLRSATQQWWWCHDIGYPLLATECKAPWSGTPCRTTSAHSRTMRPLDSVWKPGFSLATSVLSALETSWQLRYINNIYHTIQYHYMYLMVVNY